MKKKICPHCGKKMEEIKEIALTKIGNLEWGPNLGLMDWHEAMEINNGWRLPTRSELINLFDTHYGECQKLIEKDPGYTFWSSTERCNDTALAWLVTLNYGYTYFYARTAKYYVRCVRP